MSLHGVYIDRCITVPDPDLEIIGGGGGGGGRGARPPGGGGGGGGGSRSSRPLDGVGESQSPKKIFRPFGSRFGLKIMGGTRPPGPSLGSATE